MSPDLSERNIMRLMTFYKYLVVKSTIWLQHFNRLDTVINYRMMFSINRDWEIHTNENTESVYNHSFLPCIKVHFLVLVISNYRNRTVYYWFTLIKITDFKIQWNITQFYKCFTGVLRYKRKSQEYSFTDSYLKQISE